MTFNTKTKSEFVQIRMTPKDKKNLQDKAKQSGKSVTDFIRDKTLKS